MIDWSISIGSLLQMVVIVAGGMWVFQALRADVKIIRHDMTTMKQRQDDLGEAFKQLGTILTQVAVQDERLNQMNQTINEMRHGQGFVNPMRT